MEIKVYEEYDNIYNNIYGNNVEEKIIYYFNLCNYSVIIFYYVAHNILYKIFPFSINT